MMKKTMRVAGLTGGMASGKTLVLQQFMKLGAYVIDCDVLSREAVIPCSMAWWEIVRCFGTEIVRHDLELDRKRLRDLIFNDAEKRVTLEKIVHPVVNRKMRERIAAIAALTATHHTLVVVDVPLLIETGVQHEFDAVVVVYCSEETQIQRISDREGVTRAEARKMIALQLPLTEKLPFADYVITNEGTREETENQVRAIFAELSP
ncbi:MAG TPA: dephospho-CoA kinase [Methanomicrobia archaeon]|nr:dephospho-CoA kinase [Methanomicrobia archaeon]